MERAPPAATLRRCRDAVLEGDREAARNLARAAVEEGLAVAPLIEEGFAAGMRRAGRLWEEGEYFLPDVAFSAEAMKEALDVLEPSLPEQEADEGIRVLIGTVEGDIHDIGKTLVGMVLTAHGYDVLDLGVDVAEDSFVEHTVSHRPHVLGLSALLTTTMPAQRRLVERLRREGLRDRVKVVVGGAPTSADWAREIGADGYAENALDAIAVLDSLTDST